MTGSDDDPRHQESSADRARRRLAPILRSLSTTIRAEPIKAQVSIGDVILPIYEARHPSRLPSVDAFLSDLDPFSLEQLRWIAQKYKLGQDVFLLGASAGCGYSRRLALGFCALLRREYEYVAIHRDVGESELKQAREILSESGQKRTIFVDSPTVRAVKLGRILILDGIEKAERGILPLLNNLLENREMNLEDGTQIIHPERYGLIQGPKQRFISAHPDFQVICLGAPVPPFMGYPLDPPFRSRFQVRYIDHLGASLALAGPGPSPPSLLWSKFREVITAIQIANETRSPLFTTNMLPNFPQASLKRLGAILTDFPPPGGASSVDIPSDQLARLLMVLHPRLAYLPLTAFGILAEHLAQAGLGPLGNPATIDNQGSGLLGYTLTRVQRISSSEAKVTFSSIYTASSVHILCPCGNDPLAPLNQILEEVRPKVIITPRFKHLLNVMLQIHALGMDLALLPSDQPSAPSASTAILVHVFSRLLGYTNRTVRVYLHKELSGRELVMRRTVSETDGSTGWAGSQLVECATEGSLIQLSGVDVIGATFGSIGRLLNDREIELWDGLRIVRKKPPVGAKDEEVGLLSEAHPAFRVIATVTRSMPSKLKDWLANEELLNSMVGIPVIPLTDQEEKEIMRKTGVSITVVTPLSSFAHEYRTASMGLTLAGSSSSLPKLKRLGTRTLVRICRRLARYPEEEKLLEKILTRVLLADFLPPTERITFGVCLEVAKIPRSQEYVYPAPRKSEDLTRIIFPQAYSQTPSSLTTLPEYQLNSWSGMIDSDSKCFVPHVPFFFDNSQQSGLMREIGVDLEVLGEHLVLLGNQGVGKNKIIDRFLQLICRPREYIQLHRDTTVNQLMLQTNLVNGSIQHEDSPLIRAIKLGRVLVIDEADKAPEFVTAVFKSLAEHGELSLPDGRKISELEDGTRPEDIKLHPDFRMILLANRPGFPFLGNSFLDGLGDGFSCYAVGNPDRSSEVELVKQAMGQNNAIGDQTVERLVDVFHDLRKAFDSGAVTYPFSLRELINLFKHMKEFNQDSLETGLRNIFDFDVHRPETIDFLQKTMLEHGFDAEKLGFNIIRKNQMNIFKEDFPSKIVYKAIEENQNPKDLEVNEDDQDLKGPKHGKEDDGNEHVGGDIWGGGTGGRDTSGLGGRGGPSRVYKRTQIYQVSDKLKGEVPAYVRERARVLSQEELARKLEDLNMSSGQATNYAYYYKPVQAHISQLQAILEDLEAREHERVWLKRQGDGELDEQRLIDGLTGESAIYKRRSSQRPEPGNPQMKPKRIRFLFDISASMYRFQADGRLDRSCQTATMIMEAFQRLSRPQKYVWDIIGHAGDSPEIPLVESDSLPSTISDRWKVLENIKLFSQYAIAGDHTIEAIEKAVDKVVEMDSDEAIVIAISDANFDRYGISAELLKAAINRNSKVKTALIAIGEGSETEWLPKVLPHQIYQVKRCDEIPIVLRSILSHMIN